MQFIAFPERNDALLGGKQIADIFVESSGSIGLHYDGKCHQTYPNQTLIVNERLEWCSNIASNHEVRPWIQYSLKNQMMQLTGYSIRNGCCRYYCCCVEDGRDIDAGCCCILYSFALQGSNDNQTWVTIHKIEKDSHFYDCAMKTYLFDEKTQPFRFVRLIQLEEWPGCPRCIQINQIELYGQSIVSPFSSYEQEEDDETISIIGKVRRDD